MRASRVNRWVAAVLALAAVAHVDLPDAPPIAQGFVYGVLPGGGL